MASGRRTLLAPILLLLCAAGGVLTGVAVNRVRASRSPGPPAGEDFNALGGRPSDPARGTANHRAASAALSHSTPAVSTPYRPEAIGYRISYLTRAKAPDLHAAESRHPVWAPAMEAQVAARLDVDIKAELPGLTVEKIDCRTSTCRLELLLTHELKARLQQESAATTENGQRISSYALGAIVRRRGPFAKLSSRVSTGDDGLRESYVFIFSDEEVDPAGYAAWSARVERYQRGYAAQHIKREGPR